MSEWAELQLSDICNLISSKTSMTNASLENYVSTENMVPNFGGLVKAEKLPSGTMVNTFLTEDVLFSNIRTYFKKVWSAQFEGTVSADVLVFRAKQLCYPKFLYYTLCEPDFTEYTVLTSRGAKMPRGDKEAILSYKVGLPPLPEQKAIASILSSLDDKIDLLHRQNKTLEAMAETLFRQWFIEGAKEDWEECRLGDLIEIKGGFSYKGEFIGYGDSLLLGMGCVSFDNRFLSTGARQYAGTCSERFYAQPGDIVIATRQQSDNLPILGFPAMIPDDYKGKNVIVGTNLYSLKNHSDLSNRLIFQIFRSKDYRIHIIASAKGSTVRMITKDAIEDFCFSMPDVETINKLELHLDSLVSKLNENFKQIQTLENLRDTLLPKLMSGEVRVQYQTEEVA